MMGVRVLPVLLLSVLTAGCASTGALKPSETAGVTPTETTASHAEPCPPVEGPWVRDLTRDWSERRYLRPDGRTCRP